jgi:hypothetical protein
MAGRLVTNFAGVLLFTAPMMWGVDAGGIVAIFSLGLILSLFLAVVEQ